MVALACIYRMVLCISISRLPRDFIAWRKDRCRAAARTQIIIKLAQWIREGEEYGNGDVTSAWV